MKKLFVLMLVLTSANLYAAGWLPPQKIYNVGVLNGNGCIVTVTDQVVLVDLNTYVGRSEFALALAAKTSGKKLSVYQTDGPLVGGCNNGNTIKPHSMIRLVD